MSNTMKLALGMVALMTSGQASAQSRYFSRALLEPKTATPTAPPANTARCATLSARLSASTPLSAIGKAADQTAAQTMCDAYRAANRSGSCVWVGPSNDSDVLTVYYSFVAATRSGNSNAYGAVCN